MSNSVRNCPLCDFDSATPAFPWAIRFKEARFDYYRCIRCGTVFINPIPEESVFAEIYAKSTYQVSNYSDYRGNHYRNAASLLSCHAPIASTVLDYGCGSGYFLRACRSAGFCVEGAELTEELAESAADYAGCKTWIVSDLFSHSASQSYDVIHLGDVLEHLPAPEKTVKQLLLLLKPGGLLFVEGPLEINPSPVYWISKIFGTLRHLFLPTFVGIGEPSHLFRTGERQQLAFFSRFAPDLSTVYWSVYETGWPYIDNGFIKTVIAQLAILLGGKHIAGVTFGNRFVGIFRVNTR